MITGYRTIGVVRGVPIGFRLHPVTGACLYGIREYIKRACLARGLVASHLVHDGVFDLVLTLSPHYHTLVKQSAQRDAYTIYSKNGVLVTTFPEVLPPEVRQVDEVLAQVVWLAGTTGVYGQLVQNLVQDLNRDQVVPFTVCEIPLEMLPSLEACRANQLLSTHARMQVPFTRNIRIRPHITVFEILYILSSQGSCDWITNNNHRNVYISRCNSSKVL